jgi:hypothetical protein
MTLWTDFEIFGDARLTGFECQQRMNDYRKIKRAPNYSKIRPQDIAAIHKQSRQWLEQSLTNSTSSTNVVVSHHAPSIKSVPEHAQANPIVGAYVSDLEDTIMRYSIALWVHGHIHSNTDYNIHGCRVVCNPRGYAGHEINSDFKSDLVLTVP